MASRPVVASMNSDAGRAPREAVTIFRMVGRVIDNQDLVHQITTQKDDTRWTLNQSCTTAAPKK